MAVTLDELKGTTPEATETENVDLKDKGTEVETASGAKIKTFTPDEIGAPKVDENSLAKNFERQMDILDQGIQKNKEKLYEQYVMPQLEEAAEAELLGEELSESEDASETLAEALAEDPDDFAMEVEEERSITTMDDYKVSPVEKASEIVAVAAPEVAKTVTP